MKIKWNVSGFSVFKRMFILYSFVILFIYIILIGLFVNNIDESSNELISTRQGQNRAYMESLEEQLDNVYQQEVNLSVYPEVVKLAYSVYVDNYEKSQLVLELIQRLESIQSLHPIIEDIVITFPGQQIAISANQGYQSMEEDSWDNENSYDDFSRLSRTENKMVLNFTYPLKYSLSEDYIPDYRIQVKLSERVLKESLQNLGLEEKSSGLLWFRLAQEAFLWDNEENRVKADMTPEDYLQMVSQRDNIGKYGDYQYLAQGADRYPIYLITFIDNGIIRDIVLEYILTLTIIVLIVSGLFVMSLILTQKLLVKPVREMMSAFESIQKGDFDVRIYHEPHDEFNFLYKGFNESAQYIQELIQNLYDQECLLQNAELAQLQSQINPHFLYNSFFIINRMAKNESYELITKFVTSLAKYYRFMNKETQMFIDLETEVAHMSNYMDIQQIRFEDKIKVEKAELCQELARVKVPKLILQPVVENAYIYGMANKLAEGLIRISYKKDGDFLLIIIEDNGEEANLEMIRAMKAQLQDPDYAKENHALYNIDKRLTLAYGPESGITIGLSSLGGIKISLIINLKEND